jgi:hypothetical protein
VFGFVTELTELNKRTGENPSRSGHASLFKYILKLLDQRPGGLKVLRPFAPLAG